MTQNGQLDPTDIRILEILQQDARMDATHIGLAVHKSEAAIRKRLAKLREQGYIRRFAALLDRRLVGRPTLMITLVKLNGHASAVLQAFAAAIQVHPEVQVCLHLSGEYDFILQITLRDAAEYEDFLEQKLCCLPMVDKVHSSLVLKEYKMEPAFPLEK
ncbi:Lrp/AsnC family transcriptional regulator [Mucilaginibacter auburnensis]|uniref:Lrp/AsnC family transcriptional regulator n=1 Tax=Mucilaginibacter auburnensis TaxID=1457233 RepID=UPI000C24A351|nr:Lrp/AsnC family transcriptional regulator [Mucilaginibacter auburnensis]